MELHFYPGQKLLVALSLHAKQQIKIHGKFEAWGGPPSMGSDPRMAEEPTWPGEYTIDTAYAYRTPSWKLSTIKWGTALKDKPSKNDVWYQIKNNVWASIKNDHGISRKDIISLHHDLYQTRTVPRVWIFNDFGPVAIRWFKDTNKNKRVDGKEKLSGQMFHTTPTNEAQNTRNLPVVLTQSHGCIHLIPKDRDTLFAMGAFNKGRRFVVHQYNEKYHEKNH